MVLHEIGVFEIETETETETEAKLLLVDKTGPFSGELLMQY